MWYLNEKNCEGEKDNWVRTGAEGNSVQVLGLFCTKSFGLSGRNASLSLAIQYTLVNKQTC